MFGQFGDLSVDRGTIARELYHLPDLGALEATIRTTVVSPFTPDNLITETFEGLGLGTRIALLKFSGETTFCGIRIPRTVKPMLMAFAYGLTTPIGQAIGLALLFSPGTSYDPASRSALILVGTMNAFRQGCCCGRVSWSCLLLVRHPPPPTCID
jgi:hypothetical protein